MSSWSILAVIVLSASLGRGEYGDKVRSNGTSSLSSSETLGSSEEYYDDSIEEKPTATPEKPLTTPDDGVVIEKAILAAEITPKASYSLIDYPIRYDESLGDSYTQAKFGTKNEFFGYSSSDTSTSQEVNTDMSLEYTRKPATISNSLYNKPSKNSNPETMQKSSQTHNGYNFPSWSFLGMYNIPTQITQKPFSSTYRHLSDMEIKKATDIKTNGVGLSDDGNYDPVANGDFLHLGYQSASQHPWASFGAALSPEVSAQLEQERLFQIEATQSYLKQIEAAQEYAAKVQALQDTLYPSFQSSQINMPGWSDIRLQETFGSSTTPMTPQTSKPKVVPKTDAPGVDNFVQQNSYPSQSVYSPKSQPTAAQVNTLAGGEWMFPAFATTSPSGFRLYTGPTASPVVLPSGFLADTEEVMQARIAHLQALMNAIETTSAWKNQRSERWS